MEFYRSVSFTVSDTEMENLDKARNIISDFKDDYYDAMLKADLDNNGECMEVYERLDRAWDDLCEAIGSISYFRKGLWL